MALQLAFVLVAIIIGARLGGIGLGVMGGIGLAILTFGFGLQPTSPPIDVMLMIAAVISAASCMQAAGGLDYMVKLAERLLRKNPSQVTILSPIVTYLFTFVAGHGTCGIFGASRDCRGCHGDQDSSREATGHCGDCFAAGYYGKSHFGCHRRTAWVAGGI